MGEALQIPGFLREIWKELSDKEMKIVGTMHSKTLEKAIMSSTGLGNRRIRIGIAAIKELMQTERGGKSRVD